MKTRATIRWSWPAFVLSAAVLGQLLVVSMIFVASFRRGLDADMNLMIGAMSPISFLVGGLRIGFFASVFIAIAWWIARAKDRSPRMFFMAAVGVPTGIVFILKAIFIVGWLVDGPRGIAPFEQETLFYLPNYLEVICTGGSYALAAWTFLAASRALGK